MSLRLEMYCTSRQSKGAQFTEDDKKENFVGHVLFDDTKLRSNFFVVFI